MTSQVMTPPNPFLPPTFQWLPEDVFNPASWLANRFGMLPEVLTPPAACTPPFQLEWNTEEWMVFWSYQGLLATMWQWPQSWTQRARMARLAALVEEVNNSGGSHALW